MAKHRDMRTASQNKKTVDNKNDHTHLATKEWAGNLSSNLQGLKMEIHTAGCRVLGFFRQLQF